MNECCPKVFRRLHWGQVVFSTDFPTSRSLKKLPLILRRASEAGISWQWAPATSVPGFESLPVLYMARRLRSCGEELFELAGLDRPQHKLLFVAEEGIKEEEIQRCFRPFNASKAFFVYSAPHAVLWRVQVGN